MDVGSSRTAANVVGTVQGSLKSLVIDLAVLLEGHSTVSHHLQLGLSSGLTHSAPLCDHMQGERKSLVPPTPSHKASCTCAQMLLCPAVVQ